MFRWFTWWRNSQKQPDTTAGTQGALLPIDVAWGSSSSPKLLDFMHMCNHSYFPMANYENSSLLSTSGAIKIYSQSLPCSTTGGELGMMSNNSHIWTSFAFRARISPAISNVFKQSFLIRTTFWSLKIPLCARRCNVQYVLHYNL